MSKPHDEAARRQARQVYEAHGAQAASDTTGIPVRTVRYWAQEQSWTRQLAVAGEQERTERSARQSAAAVLGWSTRRQHAADRFGAVALKALDRLEAELGKTRPRGIQALGITASMLAKQAEEMLAAVGGPRRGDVSPEESIAYINRVLDAIEERVVGDG